MPAEYKQTLNSANRFIIPEGPSIQYLRTLVPKNRAWLWGPDAAYADTPGMKRRRDPSSACACCSCPRGSQRQLSQRPRRTTSLSTVCWQLQQVAFESDRPSTGSKVVAPPQNPKWPWRYHASSLSPLASRQPNFLAVPHASIREWHCTFLWQLDLYPSRCNIRPHELRGLRKFLQAPCLTKPQSVFICEATINQGPRNRGCPDLIQGILTDLDRQRPQGNGLYPKIQGIWAIVFVSISKVHRGCM